MHPVTDSTAEIAGQMSGEQAPKGIKLPAEDLLIGASAVEPQSATGLGSRLALETEPRLAIKFR